MTTRTLNGQDGEAAQAAALRHLIDALVAHQLGTVSVLGTGALRVLQTPGQPPLIHTAP